MFFVNIVHSKTSTTHQDLKKYNNCDFKRFIITFVT